MAIAELPQHMTALQRANEARYAAARAKARVKDGENSIEEALADPEAGSVSIHDLLMAQPRWGADRASKLLASLSISEMRRVRELVPRERRRIADACAGRQPPSMAAELPPAAPKTRGMPLHAALPAVQPKATSSRTPSSPQVVRELVGRYRTARGEPRRVVLVAVDGGRVLMDRGPSGEQVVESFAPAAGLLEIAAVAQGYLAEMAGGS